MAGENLFTEPLNQGLVNVRDPSLLRPGELVQCDNMHYLPNDQALYSAKGRTKYNSTAAPALLKGLRHLLFDDVDDLLLVHYSAAYAYSVFDNETETGGTPFTPLSTAIGTGVTLDAVHYNNKHYLLNGVPATPGDDLEGPNHVVKSSYVMRRHGLAPVASWGSTAPSLTTGSWPNDSTLPLGWYFFLFTEVHDAGGADEVESTFVGTPVAINVNVSNKGVLLTFPTTLTNAGAESDGTPLINKRRVYMSTQQADYTQTLQPDAPPLSSYALVAEVDVTAGTVTITNSGSNSGALKLPTAVASIVSGWSNLTNVEADDNNGMTSSASSAKMVAYTFGLSISGTITGIEVEVKLKGVPSAAGGLSRDTGVVVFLTKTAAGANTIVGSGKTINGLGTSYDARLVGGPNFLWDTTWVAADLTASTFGVILVANEITGHVDVDYVKVKVYAGGVALEYGVPFPCITISIGGTNGVLYVEGSHGEPPVAETGDVFESQMVLNDVSDASIIRYSLPDGVEYFPPSYYLNFESKEQDIVTAIRRLGNKLVVGLAHQIYRVNYLPRETDAEFDRGRAVEAIAEDHGIIGTQASCLFAPPDKPMLLAYASANGLHATDGYQTTTLTEDLDWDSMVEKSLLHRCILVNYPKLYMLKLFYTPPGGTHNTKALYLHYHPSHVKEGQKLVVTGPINVEATAACDAKQANDTLVLTTGVSDNYVYVEDRGYVDNSQAGGIDCALRTRDIYGAGIGYEFTIERVWVRHAQFASPLTTATFNLYFRNTQSAVVQPSVDATDDFDMTYLGLSRLDDIHAVGEAAIMEILKADTDDANNNGVGFSFIAFESAAHGLEESNQS